MNELKLTRVLPAPPERVWAALTEPGALAAWFWPERLRTEVSADVRKGGRYVIRSSTEPMAIAGEYREVDAPHRLSFTFGWEGDEDPETLVIIELTAHGENTTELTLRHERFTDAETTSSHLQGWHSCLARLPAYLLKG